MTAGKQMGFMQSRTLLEEYGIHLAGAIVPEPDEAPGAAIKEGYPVALKCIAPGLILPYSASSGCYWNKCAFCPERAEKNPYMPVYSPETRQFETKMMYGGDLSLYAGFRHSGGWDRNLVRQFLDKEFKRHPCIQKIQRRNPPFFTSNHAPFFLNEGLRNRNET